MKTEKVGQRIKAVMEKKGIILEDLSQRTGLKTELIRLIEDEDVYPSLGPLLKISRPSGCAWAPFSTTRSAGIRSSFGAGIVHRS